MRAGWRAAALVAAVVRVAKRGRDVTARSARWKTAKSETGGYGLPPGGYGLPLWADCPGCGWRSYAQPPVVPPGAFRAGPRLLPPECRSCGTELPARK